MPESEGVGELNSGNVPVSRRLAERRAIAAPVPGAHVVVDGQRLKVLAALEVGVGVSIHHQKV